MSFRGGPCLTLSSGIGSRAAVRNPRLDFIETPAGTTSELDWLYELARTAQPPKCSSGNLEQFGELGRGDQGGAGSRGGRRVRHVSVLIFLVCWDMQTRRHDREADGVHRTMRPRAVTKTIR